MNEFLNNQTFHVVVAITGALAILFILGKLGMGFVKHLLFGLVVGSVVYAVLFYGLGWSQERTAIAGLIGMVLGFISALAKAKLD